MSTVSESTRITQPIEVEIARRQAFATSAQQDTAGYLPPGALVIPYLPPLLQHGEPHYFHLVELRPLEQNKTARVVLGRYAWSARQGHEGWKLVAIDPLELRAMGPTPYVVAGPLALNPECPQAWRILEAECVNLSITAVPRRPGLNAMNLVPGVSPPEEPPYVLSLHPTMALPRTNSSEPCRIEVYPLTETCTFAMRMRIFSKGIPKGETPFLFHATVASPKAWEISHGHRISQIDPATGHTEHVLDATYESGELCPSVTVFSGRMLAVFLWQPDPRSGALNAAALVPEGVPAELPIFSAPNLRA